MKGTLKGRTVIYCAIIIILAIIFISLPIKNILFGTYLGHLQRPQITQGLKEIAIACLVGMSLILFIKNKTLKSILLLICAFLYLQNHQFLVPFLISTVYIEMIISIGTSARKLSGFKIESNYMDYLSSFVYGVAIWGSVAIVFSLCGKGTFIWLRIITIGLYAISLLIYRRVPISLYFVNNLKERNDREQLFIWFLSILVLIQGAKSYAAFDYDSLWYGLSPENVLIGENSFYDNLGMLVWVHYYPKFFELFVAPLSDLGESSLIHAVNIWLYVLLLVGVYGFLMELKLSNIKVLFYTLIVATVPAIANISTTAKPDVFTGFLTVFSALCFFRSAKENDFSYIPLAYAAIMLGACGKISSYLYMAILVISGTITFILLQKKEIFKTIFQKNNIPCLLILGTSAFVLIGTFYRTYILTGYPLYPFSVNFWKKIGFDGVYPFADYFGGQMRGFAEGTIFNLQFYLRHIYNLIFEPGKVGEYHGHHLTICWYSNFGIFLSVILVLNFFKMKKYESGTDIKEFAIASGILLPVWIGMIFIAVFFFRYATDGNYFIVPICLGFVYLAYIYESKIHDYKKLHYVIFTVFIILQFFIMFVSHPSWSLGTSTMGFHLFDSSFDSDKVRMWALEYNGVEEFEEYITWQSYTKSRALGEGNEEVFFRLSTGYEDVTSAMGMTRGIFDNEENLLKYLNWADINFLILPKSDLEFSDASSQYQNFVNVFKYYRSMDNVFELDTENYILLDITSYTDSANRRKEGYYLLFAPTYKLGQEIIFASNYGETNSSKYVVDGMGGDEGSHCWTIGKEVKIAMKLEDKSKKDLIGHLHVMTAQNNVQRVQIVVNGEVSWEGEVRSGEIEFPFKYEEYISINIIIPNAQSPQEADSGGDVRQLGLAVTKMWIDG